MVIITIYFVCLSCQVIERSFFKRNEDFSLYDINGNALTNYFPQGHEVSISGKPFLGHRYFKLSLSYLCPGAERNVYFNEIHQLHFLSKSFKGTLNIYYCGADGTF